MPKKRVLVIDDERIIRQLLTKSLSDEGYDVETAPDGLEGLEKVERDTFDVVLVDLKLPGKDGLEVLQIIKENYPEILRILITAYPSIETARQSMKTGAFSYITKPLDPDEVSSAIEKGLEKKRFDEKAIELS